MDDHVDLGTIDPRKSSFMITFPPSDSCIERHRLENDHNYNHNQLTTTAAVVEDSIRQISENHDILVDIDYKESYKHSIELGQSFRLVRPMITNNFVGKGMTVAVVDESTSNTVSTGLVNHSIVSNSVMDKVQGSSTFFDQTKDISKNFFQSLFKTWPLDKVFYSSHINKEADNHLPPREVEIGEIDTFYHNHNHSNNNNNEKEDDEDPTGDGEHLGENFLNTKWLPPSIARAYEYRKQMVFMEGNAPFFSTQVTSTPELSEGICSYFEFVMSFSIYMLLSTMLVMPMLVFSYYGSKISEEDRDSIGFYRFTLGNMGYDSSSSTYDTDSKCSFSTSSKCIHLSGGLEMSYYSISYLMMTMEILQQILFFIFILRLQSKVSWLHENLSSSVCRISDYSVIVRGLPKDTKIIDLVNHFSNLYALNKKDWRNRPIVDETSPVQNCFNSGHRMFIGTWVADCSIRKPIGSLLRMYKSRQNLIEKLFRSRAQMKMYSMLSSHAYSKDQLRYKEAKILMKESIKQLKNMTDSILQDTKIQLRNHHKSNHQGREKANNDDNYNDNDECLLKFKDIEDDFDTNITAAFISFEYSESKARAIEDYSKYSKFPWSLFCWYPKELLFHGKRLLVKKASEPDEIIWENLEISMSTKFWRRLRTAIVSFILCLGCFIAIVQSTIYKDRLTSKIPSTYICSTVIPTLYTNSHSNASISNIELTRPSNSDIREELDASCSSIISNSFYATYLIDGNEAEPIASYSFESCLTNQNSSVNICPVYGDVSYCPCVSTSSTISCESAACTVKTSSSCFSFEANKIGTCYCKSQLYSLISSKGPFDTINRLKNLQSSSVCNSFFVDYISASSFVYVAVLVTVIVNRILLVVLKTLTEWECHSSIDKIQGALMLKIFVLLYINLSILIILASGYIKIYSSSTVTSSFISQLHLFQGSYYDFTSSWYGNVGSYLVSTYIIQAFIPIVYKLFIYFIYSPLQKVWVDADVRSIQSHIIVRQQDLNKLFVGPTFDSTNHQAQLLAFLFFVMTYAPGLPIIVPLSFVFFSLYFIVDKLLLLRYNKRPPQMGNETINKVLSWLPYALIIRLCIASWMFSTNDIVTSAPAYIISNNYDENEDDGSINNQSPGYSYYSFLISIRNIIVSNAPILEYVTERMCQPQVFVFIILLILLIIFELCSHTSSYLYQIVIQSSCLFSSCNHQSNKLSILERSLKLRKDVITPYDIQRQCDPLRQEIAPLTKEYYKFILRKRSIIKNMLPCWKNKVHDALSKIEVMRGWEIIPRHNRLTKVKRWLRQSDQNHNNNDSYHSNSNDSKFTYEIIKEYGCSSYMLDQIPSYKSAVEGLRHIVSTIKRDRENIV